jgi:hypothetical protein
MPTVSYRVSVHDMGTPPPGAVDGLLVELELGGTLDFVFVNLNENGMRESKRECQRRRK